MAAKADRTGAWMLPLLLLSATMPGCNAPKRTPEETRMYPKAPLQQMGPLIKAEPTTAMSRLAHLNKPGIVEIPVDSVVPPAKK